MKRIVNALSKLRSRQPAYPVCAVRRQGDGRTGTDFHHAGQLRWRGRRYAGSSRAPMETSTGQPITAAPTTMGLSSKSHRMAR